MKMYLTKASQRAAEAREQGEMSTPKKVRAPKEARSPRKVAVAIPKTAGTTESSVAETPDTLVVETRKSKPEKIKTSSHATTRTRTKSKVLTIGGVPRVDLLPKEVRLERRGSQKVRRVWIGVVGVAALVIVASAGAGLLATDAKNNLADAQARTSGLLAEQKNYVEVQTVQDKVDLIKAGQSVGGSTEIDWTSYLAKVQASLPAGVTVTSIDLSSSSPLIAFAQASTPLQGVRVATLNFTATSSALPVVPTWLDGLAKLPGFTDANPDSVSLANGVYTTSVTMHINEAAYSGRYTAKGK